MTLVHKFTLSVRLWRYCTDSVRYRGRHCQKFATDGDTNCVSFRNQYFYFCNFSVAYLPSKSGEEKMTKFSEYKLKSFFYKIFGERMEINWLKDGHCFTIYIVYHYTIFPHTSVNHFLRSIHPSIHPFNHPSIHPSILCQLLIMYGRCLVHCHRLRKTEF